MRPRECERERELLRVVLGRHWPDGADPALRAHVESCEVCSDVLDVATLLEGERHDALHDAQLPAAGQVWWRAALRAHAEGARAARRPMVLLQGIAAACAVALVAALLTLAWPSIYEATTAAAGLRSDVAPFFEMVRGIMPIVITVLACLVVTPILVYFALSDE